MRVRVLACVVILLAACCPAFPEDDGPPPALLELIARPDQVEIPCKIHFGKPELMFQQQYALVVHGEFSHKLVEHGEVRHLQMLAKVRDGQGRWLVGEDFDDFKIPEHLHGHDIAYSAIVYFRPGQYHLAIAIRDTESHKANVYHEDVTIAALPKDPFPLIDGLLPEAEFPGQVDDKRELLALDPQMESIALPNEKPTRLDIVLNITKRFRWDAFYRMDVQNMLASGSVLGRFRPAKGCVRLSVIDVLRTEVVLDRFPVERLNWERLQEAIAKIDQNIVDVHVLENQKKVAQFTEGYLQRIAADKTGCATWNDPSPLVVVVSPDVVLPYGNKLDSLAPLPRNAFLYVHLGWGSAWQDGIGQILSSAKPQKFNCSTPREFRSALAKIAGLISGVGTAGPH